MLSTTSLRFGRTRGFQLATPPFEVHAGEVLGFLGPNGSGKSTLLQLLSGYLRPQQGEVSWRGVPFPRHSRAQWAQAVAVVPQEAGVIPPLTVHEYVRLGRVPFRGLLQSFTTADHDAVELAIERCGIACLRNELLAELSGGQRQRARIARALAQGSQLLILDEPTNHLDLSAIRDVTMLITTLASEGTAFIASLHNLDVASYVTTHTAFIVDGSVQAMGPTATTLTPELVLHHLGVAVDAAPRGGGRLAFSLRYPDAALVSRDVEWQIEATEAVPSAPFGDIPSPAWFDDQTFARVIHRDEASA